MKSHLSKVMFFVLIQFGNIAGISAQNSALNQAIEKIRKGEIVVKAKSGSIVKIEQLKHEFWFGCAIPNSFADGSMSEGNRQIFKEKFLENFNSAVTENAVKWGTMARKKGEVDFSVIDSILNWTEEIDIPIRGHKIFWGIT